ncbi:MAG: tRNA pseudouridine(38-40) synthase TruA [Lachnospiraceae bacterium]|nr:tRNA pseudouridine(38-40) synthase TruA [Lachnospiraceae bacterium]
MRRILLTVAYDGTNYVGWQYQPNGTSIEEVLNAALKKLLKEPEVHVIGCSRTDSGVHADGNLCVFDTESRIPGEKFRFALNEFLPRDITVQESAEVAPDFHPRKQNSIKTYEYRILNRRVPLPKERNYSYFYYYPLDDRKMQQAADFLLGEHDFRSFCSIRTNVEDTVRRITRADVVREGDFITLTISGTGFLYNMVRIIVGTLVRVGTGFIPPEQMGEILEARDRAKAGPRAPAMGLTLKSIISEPPLEGKLVEDNPHWAYVLDYDRLSDAGVGFFDLQRSDEADFDALLLRNTKFLSRNAARRILLYDRTGRVKDGMQSAYFTWHRADAGEVKRLFGTEAPEGAVFETHDERLLESAETEEDED